jgi:hypothetical protein
MACRVGHQGVYSISPRRRASPPLCLRGLWRLTRQQGYEDSCAPRPTIGPRHLRLYVPVGFFGAGFGLPGAGGGAGVPSIEASRPPANR